VVDGRASAKSELRPRRPDKNTSSTELAAANQAVTKRLIGLEWFFDEDERRKRLQD